MTQKFVFIDRRRANERRTERDPCKEIPMDLYHRKRRKSLERRDVSKSLSDDYYSYVEGKSDQDSKKIRRVQKPSSRPN